MIISLTIPGRAPSLNNAKSPAIIKGKIRLISSRKGTEGMKRVEHALTPYQSVLEAFGRQIDRSTHSIGMRYDFQFPKEVFFTKSGQLALGLPDVDNSFKTIKDKIFKAMGLNDGLVTELFGQRTVGEVEQVVVHIYRIALDPRIEDANEEKEVGRPAVKAARCVPRDAGGDHPL